ncbi:MAG: hypothetical protein JNN01_12755 [Opitutaceae bacterium]|nr:hypothetical protein [Opitutaceae bacterium]
MNAPRFRFRPALPSWRLRGHLFVSFALCQVSLAEPEPAAAPPRHLPADLPPPIFAPKPVTGDKAASAGGKSGGESRRVSPTSSPGTAPATRTSRRRALSPEMSGKISNLLTRDLPPITHVPMDDAAPAPPASDGDDSDRLALEPYHVTEDRLPAFKEREILTPKGKLALARRRYPGTNPGSALLLLEADFDKERRQELSDLNRLLEINRSELSPDTQRLIRDTRIPPTDTSPAFSGRFRPPP